MGEVNIKKVIALMINDKFLNFFEYQVQTINPKETNMKTQGNSGTAIPTYQVLWLGTGKKLTRERIKRIRMRINRTNVFIFLNIRLN